MLALFLLGTAHTLAAQCVSLTTLGSAYTQNFDALSNTAGSTTNNLTITGWFLTESGGGARDNEQYAVDTGGSTTGDTYSYGAAGSTDRALGSLRSGTLIPVFGACFTNDTGSTITRLDVAYTGEQWRLGTAGRTDEIDFAYSLSATDLITGTWTGVAALNFLTPDTTTTGAKNGNAAGERTALSSTIGSLSIAPGATVWIRWTDSDASGADDGLAVDDFSLTPQSAASGPTLSINDVSLNEGNSGTTTFSFTVSLTAPAPAGGVTFDIATTDGTATASSGDYVTKSLTSQTIPAGSSTYTFDVQVNGDTTNEPNETFFVNVTNVVGAVTGDAQGQGTIVNDDAPPTLSIDSVSQAEGNSGTTTFNFTVTLSASPAAAVTVDYATADGTATTADNDYVAASSTLTFAAGTATLTQTIAVTVNGDTNNEPDETFTVALSNATNATIATATGTGTILNDDMPTLSIMEIQGHGARSSYAGAGNTVGTTLLKTPSSGRANIVTAVKSSGFFMQDALGDGDPTTSDGIFVFTGSAPAVAIGDSVSVTGKIQEFGGATEITGTPTVSVISSGNPLPAAYDLSANLPQTDPTQGICVGGASTVNPATDGYQASNFACLDGMLVRMSDGIVAAPTTGSGGSGIKVDTARSFYAVAGGPRPFREPGLPITDSNAPANPGIPKFDGNPEVLQVFYPGLNVAPASLPNGGIYNAGQHFDLTGVLQGFQQTSSCSPNCALIYEIYPRSGSDLVLTGTAPTYPVAVADAAPGKLTIGSQNMLHMFNNTADGADTSNYNDTCAGTGSSDTCPTLAQYQARLNKLSLQIRTVLKAPIIQVVQEAENYSVMSDLAAKMQADDASIVYQPYLIKGNDPGGINLGFFVRSGVTVNSVTQLYLNSTTSACSTGSSCLLNDRPPVLLDATWNGYHVRVLAIYHRSLLNLGVNDYVGRKRRQQAEQVACVVQALQTAGATVDCDANAPGAAAGNAQQDASGSVTSGAFPVTGDAAVPVVVVGDFNAYEFSDGYVDVTGTIMGTVDADPAHSLYPPTAAYVRPGPVLFDTGSAASAANHYSYTFNGFAQEIDHILLTHVGQNDFVQIFNAHGNADVSSSSTDVTDGSTARRSSDHDGQVAVLGWVVTPSATSGGSISPATAQTVSSANPIVFSVVPGAGNLAVVTDTCASAGAAAGSYDSGTNTYTIPAGVNNDCQVNATFNAIPSYTVTTTLNGVGGSISAPAQSPVTQGGSTTFTVSALTGYSIGSVVGDTCTPGVQSGNTWTSGAITANCTITATFTANPVDGVCGSDNGQTLPAAPTNLCSAGTASAISGSGHPWTWNCNGANGGANATCSATVATWVVSAVVSGSGGSIAPPASLTVDNSMTTSFTAVPDAGYALSGVAGCGATVAGNTITTGAITAACTVTVTFSANPVDGACGSDNGLTLNSTPTHLCSAGAPTAVTGSGPWTWSCQGSNGGTTAACSANAVAGSLAVLGGSGAIANGDNAPSVSKGTDFGNVPLGSQASHSFTISNAGAIPTSIGSAPKVTTSGGDAIATFALALPSASGDLVISSITSSNPAFTISGGTGTVPKGASATFTVTFAAASVGAQNGTIRIASNDPSAPAFTFAVTANAVAAPAGAAVAAPALDANMLLLLIVALATVACAALRRRASLK